MPRASTKPSSKKTTKSPAAGKSSGKSSGKSGAATKFASKIRAGTDPKKTAVIALAGKQFKVREGDELTIDRATDQANDQAAKKGTDHANNILKVTDVLLVTDGDELKIGTPTVPKASVELKITHQGRAPKLRVATFRAKARQRRVKGHRQPQTTFEVVKISA